MSQRGRWHSDDVVGVQDSGFRTGPRTGRNAEAELHELVSGYYEAPLGFVRDCFPWNQPGPLAAYSGPDVWQCEFLEWLGSEIKNRAFDGIHPVMPIRAAVSSGHGIGKGALTGMLVAFLMSTRRDCKGVITANTNTQLQDKTWANVEIWVKRCLTAHWFELNTSIMYRKGFRASWKCSPQTCDPDNSEAFAGQHNVASTSFYINDEDSNVPNIIHEVQEGGLTDGEPMQFLFGNPTRRRGAFYDIVFGGQGKRWQTWVIDARTCAFPNKALIADQLEDYGEDSDRFRVRVRGLKTLSLLIRGALLPHRSVWFRCSRTNQWSLVAIWRGAAPTPMSSGSGEAGTAEASRLSESPENSRATRRSSRTGSPMS